MRVSRWDWLARFFSPKIGVRQQKKAKPVAAKESSLPLPWIVRRHAMRMGTVRANTRSEARAEAKKMLGVPRKRRLPLDATLERVPVA